VVGSSYTVHNYLNEQEFPFEDMHHHSNMSCHLILP